MIPYNNEENIIHLSKRNRRLIISLIVKSKPKNNNYPKRYNIQQINMRTK